MRIKSALIIFMVSVFFLINCSAQPSGQDPKKGKVIKVENEVIKDGKRIILYEKSYALLIGIWNYKNGWTELPRENIESEIIMVEKALVKHNFEIRRVMNPTFDNINKELAVFRKYGFKTNNRLLFYFSGHGMSTHHFTKGYIVPKDAPFPSEGNEIGFLEKAISMDQLKALAKDIVSNHVLFVFDSCFSGTILQHKSGIVPEYIKKDTAEPVRQFITAGKANQTVPPKSVFTPAFVRGINGEADLYKDGYVTGRELFQYIKPEVEKCDIDQNPQYGTIKVHDNQYEGDFVFILNTPKICSVKIESTPSNSDIEIDGVNKGLTPKTIQLNTGKKYQLEINKNGYKTYTKTIYCSNLKDVNALLERNNCFESLGCEVTVSIGTILEVRESFEYSNDKKYWICFIDDYQIWPMEEISEPGFKKSIAVPIIEFHGGKIVLISTHGRFNGWTNNNPLLKPMELNIILETKINIK